MVKFRAGFWHAYLLTDPDDIRHVLQENNGNYRKGMTFDHLRTVVGRGLLTNEGESWLRQRRLVQPGFHHQRLSDLAGVIVQSAEEAVGRWNDIENGRTVDVAREMSALAIDIVGRALFGADLGDRAPAIADAVAVVQAHINRRLFQFVSIPGRYPTPANLRFRRALRVLDDVVFSIIENRRTATDERSDLALKAGTVTSGNHGDRNDLLGILIEAQDEETGEGMTDLELRDEVMTVLLAGHETTANVLAWAWHFLAANPEVEHQLLLEVDTVAGGRLPCLADIEKLTFTRMIIDETLRLRPPVWVIGRFPIRDDLAGGYRIPAHSSVLLSPYVTHHLPDLWPDPGRFDPERFRPGCAPERPRFAYFPFGGGPRGCIGSEFALMEGVLALATIARRVRFRPLAGHAVEPEPLITLRPRGGLPMLIERRQRRSFPASDGRETESSGCCNFA